MTDRSAASEAQARLDRAKADLKLAIERNCDEADRRRAVERIEREQSEMDRLRRAEGKLAHRRSAGGHLVVAKVAADHIARIDAEVAAIGEPLAATGLAGRVRAFRDRRRISGLKVECAFVRDELFKTLRLTAHEADTGSDDLRPVHTLSQGARGASDLANRLRSAAWELGRVTAREPQAVVVDLAGEPTSRHASLRLLLDDVQDKIDHELGFGSLRGADGFSRREWTATPSDRDELRVASQTILAMSDRCLNGGRPCAPTAPRGGLRHRSADRRRTS